MTTWKTTWEPLQPVKPQMPRPDQVEAFGGLIDHLGVLNDEYFSNDLYQVAVRRHLKAPTFPSLITHLSIKGHDRQALHNWRHFQYIKNQLVGPQNQAVEIYPAEDFLVDTANQYHLWVFEDPECQLPFGFFARLVSEDQIAGTRQEPWEENMKPADLRNMKDALDAFKSGH